MEFFREALMTENERKLVLMAFRNQYTSLFKAENYQQMLHMYASAPKFPCESFDEIRDLVCEEILNKAKQLSEDIRKISLG